jgi:hypothetical protein
MGRPRASTKEALRTALLDQFCAMPPEDRRAFLELAAMQDRAIRISEGAEASRIITALKERKEEAI